MATNKIENIYPIQSKYVDLRTDYGFKLVFGDSELLIHFLNSLFEKDGKIIKSVKYLNKEIVKTHKQGRTIFYDILCKIDGEEDIIIEMQHHSQETFGERALYYMSSSIVAQGTNKTNWNYDIHPIYGIFIMDFHLSGQNVPKEAVYEVNLTYTSTKELFSNKFRMFFIDLLYFNKTEDELETNLECWIYNIKNMGNISTTPKMAKKKPFAKLYSRAEIAKMTVSEYREYQETLNEYRTFYCIKETQRHLKQKEREEVFAEGIAKGKAEGKAEGITEGIAKGKAEGITEGIAMGKAEGKAEGITEGIAMGKAEGKAEGITEGIAKGKIEAQLANIKSIMQNFSMDFETVVKILNIPEEQIQILKEQINNSNLNNDEE
ncbi:MAG: Rpn family recombination-promoting nuclease/putative transposase [Bacteroidales bacterium]|nr:Rpn family recombination-promoting nuclease/putative transposase [Bacteroidales bacterium]